MWEAFTFSSIEDNGRWPWWWCPAPLSDPASLDGRIGVKETDGSLMKVKRIIKVILSSRLYAN
jgi:hypothetical protein